MLHNSKQNINLAQLNFGPTTGEYYKMLIDKNHKNKIDLQKQNILSINSY